MDSTFLQNHSLFGGVSLEQIELILPFFSEAVFERDAFIEREGERGSQIFFITEGSVEIIKKLKHADGFRRLLVLGEGDTFGEMELIDVQPCAASVRALEHTVTLTLSHKGLYQIHKTNCEIFALIIMNLAREISRRLRIEDELLAEFQASGAIKKITDDFGLTRGIKNYI